MASTMMMPAEVLIAHAVLHCAPRKIQLVHHPHRLQRRLLHHGIIVVHEAGAGRRGRGSAQRERPKQIRFRRSGSGGSMSLHRRRIGFLGAAGGEG